MRQGSVTDAKAAIAELCASDTCSGYVRRSLIKANMRCMKLLGERLSARTNHRATSELQIRAAFLNRFTALGAPETMRAA